MPENFTLYNGEVVLSFAGGKQHRYKVSDKGSKPEHCPSVTTILNVLNKPALVEWGVRMACDYVHDNLQLLIAGDSFSVQDVFKIVEQARTAHDRKREEAAEIGTNVHDWLSSYWKYPSLPPMMPKEPREVNCIEAALSWFKERDLRPLKVEDPLYSRALKICGRPDWIGHINWEFSVLDYKSTRKLYPEVCLQETFYAMMHKEEFGELPATRWALRLDKESGEFEARKYPAKTFEDDLDTCLAVFKIYDRLKHLRRVPKKEDFLADL